MGAKGRWIAAACAAAAVAALWLRHGVLGPGGGEAGDEGTLISQLTFIGDEIYVLERPRTAWICAGCTAARARMPSFF